MLQKEEKFIPFQNRKISSLLSLCKTLNSESHIMLVFFFIFERIRGILQHREKLTWQAQRSH